MTEMKTLNSTAKQLLELIEKDDTNRPVTFRHTSEMTEHINEQKAAQAAAPAKYDMTVYWDLKREIEFHKDDLVKYLSHRTANQNIQTDNDIFDKQAFEADVNALADQYDSLTKWLEQNRPQSYADTETWYRKKAYRDNLVNQRPSKLDAKYHSKEVRVCIKSGNELLNEFKVFDANLANIRAAIEDKYKADYISHNAIKLDEDDFKFLKQLHQFGQLDFDKMPVIDGCKKANLEKALWNFESVAEYNNSLNDAWNNNNISTEISNKVKDQFQSLMNDSIKDDFNMLKIMINDFLNEQKLKAAVDDLRSSENPFK